jgi:GMP synthase-like glutamine amidotransferase
VSEAVRILVVQNDDDKHAGRIGLAMEAAGAELTIAMAYGPIPSAADFDGLVVLPGLGDPVDDEQAIHDARDAIIEAKALQRPVLGVCLGGQLLAQSAGAEIYRSAPELGIHPVRTTPAAQDDPLFTGIPTEYESFHAHAFGDVACDAKDRRSAVPMPHGPRASPPESRRHLSLGAEPGKNRTRPPACWR